MSDAIRICIGTEDKTELARLVLQHSITRRTAAPVEFTPMIGSAWEYPTENLRVGTGFSLRRWMIPAYFGWAGRAVYLDADQIVLGDVAELWAYFRLLDAADGPTAAMTYQPSKFSKAPHPNSSVMLVDCERAKRKLDANVEPFWDISKVLAHLVGHPDKYPGLMYPNWMVPAPGRVHDCWNHLNTFVPQGQPKHTRLLHYTKENTQPWYVPGNPHASLWEAELVSAIGAGVVPRDLFEEGLAKFGVQEDWRKTNGLHPHYASLRDRFPQVTVAVPEAAPQPSFYAEATMGFAVTDVKAAEPALAYGDDLADLAETCRKQEEEALLARAAALQEKFVVEHGHTPPDADPSATMLPPGTVIGHPDATFGVPAVTVTESAPDTPEVVPDPLPAVTAPVRDRQTLLWVTSFPKVLEASGRKLIDSYLAHATFDALNPSALVAYTEGGAAAEAALLFDKKFVAVEAIDRHPMLEDFLNRHQAVIPATLGGACPDAALCKCGPKGRSLDPHDKKHKLPCPGYWFCKHAVRWFRKAIALTEAAKIAPEYLVWVDADCEFTAPVTVDTVLGWFNGGDTFYLKATREAPDTGVFGVRLGSPAGKKVFDTFVGYYASGAFRRERRWDDCWLFQKAIKEVPGTHRDLATKATGHSEVVPNSPVGKVLTHAKGSHSRVQGIYK